MWQRLLAELNFFFSEHGGWHDYRCLQQARAISSRAGSSGKKGGNGSEASPYSIIFSEYSR